MNKYTSNTENNLSSGMVNLTRFLKMAYETNDQELLDSFKDPHLDFCEISKKEILNKSSYRYLQEESLAINMITHLPLEYYKPYINIDWINAGRDSDYSIINQAFGMKKYDFIIFMLDFIKEHLITEKINSGSTYYFYEKALTSVFDIDKHLNDLTLMNTTDKNVYDRYREFTKVIIPHLSWYCSNTNRLKNRKVSSDLITNSRLMDDSFNTRHSTEDSQPICLINHFITNPLCYDFYVDSLINNKNELLSLDSLKKALSFSNELVIDKIIKENNYSSKDILNCFDSILQEKTKDIIGKNTYNKNIDGYINKTLNILNKYFPITEKELEKFSKFFLLDPLFKDFNLINTSDSLIKNYSALEISNAYQLFELYISYLPNGNKNQKDFIYLYSKKIYELFPVEKYSEFIKNNEKIISFIKDNLLTDYFSTEEKKGFEQFLLSLKLDLQIPNQLKKDIKHKI